MHIDLSTNDTRDYRYRQLENGLQLLLVSSPEDISTSKPTTKDAKRDNMAAACLCVRYGSFSDPIEMPGCANLLSRVLLLESNAYSGDESLPAYLQKHNGETGSFCTYEYTTFCFQIGVTHLAEALKRFVTHFECPTIPAEGIKQALLCMDKEYKKLKATDSAAFRQFISYLAKENSPFQKFHKGCTSSIRGNPEKSIEDIRQMLLDQFAAHYSPHLMTLAVQSSDSLDELESMVTKVFSRLRKNPAADMNFSQFGDSFNNQNFTKFYKVIPNKPKEVLRLVWCLTCLRSQYRANPMLILSSLIKNMNEGGLGHYLEENFLAMDLDCDFGTLCEFSNSTICTIFVIRMNLTQTGTQRIPEICGAVYDYLKFLASEADRSLHEGDQRNWNFLWDDESHTFSTYVRELKIIQESQFIDQPVHSAYVSTIWLANMMHRVAKEDLFSGYFLIKDCNFQLYYDLLSRMSKQNLCIIWCAPYLATELDRDTHLLKERTTELKYIVCDIPAEVTERRLQERPQIRFSLPAKNRLISEKFMHLPCSNDTKPPTDFNALAERLRYRDYGSLWVQASKEFENPKATFAIRLISSIALESVRNSTLMILFCEELRHRLSVMKKLDNHKRMKYDISVDDGALEIRISGPSEYIREFYSLMLSNAFRRNASMDLEFSESLRAMVRTKLSQAIADLDKLALNTLFYLTHKPSFLMTEQIDQLSSITIADQMAFVTQLLCQLRLTAYGRGDIDLEELKGMYDRTIRTISCIPVTSIREIRPVTIPPGTYRFEEEHRGTNTHRVLFGRYCISPESNAFAEAYNQAIVELLLKEAPVFFNNPVTIPNEVKVAVQYIRSVPMTRGPGAILTTVETESNSKFSEILVELLSTFWICVVPHIIAGIEAYEFQRTRTQLMNKIRQQFSTTDRPFDTNWKIISKYDAEFNIANEMISHVNSMTREKLLQYFAKGYIDPMQQKSIILQIKPPTRFGYQKSFQSPVKTVAEDTIQTHVKHYFTASKLDSSLLTKHANVQQLIAKAYPENIKHITDSYSFRIA